MNKASINILILVSLSFIALLIWQVFVGFNNSRSALRENLELVLRDNRLTNQVFFEGHIRRLNDLASIIVQTGIDPAPTVGCQETSNEGCLNGLVIDRTSYPTSTHTPTVDCGQRDLVAALKGETERTYSIGPTVWMPSQTVMAPIAHALQGDAGWMAACIRVDQIREVWQNLELPQKTSMALVRSSDFHLWIREPFTPDLLGRDLSDGPLVTSMLAQGVESEGVADITATKTDFVQRTVQWSPIGIDDLVLVVGYPKSHFFDTWFNREAVHLAVLVVLCAAFIGLALFASRRISKQFHEVSNLAKRLSIATSGGGVGVFDYDVEHDSLEWNDEMFRIYGVDRTQFGGKFSDWRSAVHPEDLEEVERLFDFARDSNEQFRTDFRIVRPDGTEVWIFAVAEFTDYENTTPKRLLGVNIDVSERVLIQNNLEELARQLASERDKSEQENQAKTDFMAHMSHEIRTPLNAILGFAETLQIRMDSEAPLAKDREYVESIIKGGRHLLNLADEFLEVAKIENHSYEVKIGTYRAKDIIEDAVEVMMPLVQDGMSFETKIDENLDVSCDRRAMHQCLLNLMTNAVKFSPSGGIIRVGARPESGRIVIFVEDSGDGIDEQLLERIGQPFLRSNSPTISNPQGVGLGLAITKRLIESQGGELKISSKAGAGTRAELIL